MIYLYMESIASELLETINEYLPKLNSLTEEKSSIKPLPNKWSKKELIGHLIDSAQNNIRRFIVAQYEDNPVIRLAKDYITHMKHHLHQVLDLTPVAYP